MVKENLFKRAAKTLEEVTGIQAEKVKSEARQISEIDGQVNLHAPQVATEFLLNLNLKRNLTNAALGNFVVTHGKQLPKTVLVADYITPEQAEKLRQTNIPFFDAAGNAYFN